MSNLYHGTHEDPPPGRGTDIRAAGLARKLPEAKGAIQSVVSLKLKRLETFLGRRLVERTPRSVRLTTDGEAFLEHATTLLVANERALSVTQGGSYR